MSQVSHYIKAEPELKQELYCKYDKRYMIVVMLHFD